MTLDRVGLVVHGGRAEARAAARTVREWCAEHAVACADIDVWQEGARHSAREEMDAAGDPDLVVTLGGDGTFLRGARLAAENDALLLGVDLGRVGFLTEVPAPAVRSALDAVRAGRITVENRMMLTMRASCRLEVPAQMEALTRYGRGPMLPPPRVRAECEAGGDWGVALNVTALNDIVLEKLARNRQVSVAVYLAGRLLACYSADALLVATPTGSTAYSFAVRTSCIMAWPIVMGVMPKRTFVSLVPSMISTASSGLWLIRQGGRYSTPLLKPPSTGSSNTQVRPLKPSSITA